MSSPGLSIRIGTTTRGNERTAVPMELLCGPDYVKALELLGKRLMVRPLLGGQPTALEIQAVQTYPELEGFYRDTFDLIEGSRQPNSLFLVPYRGGHLVNVVRIKSGSVICIKEVKGPKFDAGGKQTRTTSPGSHLKRILGDKLEELDGHVLDDPDSQIYLTDKEGDPIMDIITSVPK